MYLEEASKFEWITSALDKLDHPYTLSTVLHNSDFTLQRASPFVCVVNRDSDIPHWVLIIFRNSRRIYVLLLESSQDAIEQLLAGKERMELCESLGRTEVLEAGCALRLVSDLTLNSLPKTLASDDWQ